MNSGSTDLSDDLKLSSSHTSFKDQWDGGTKHELPPSSGNSVTSQAIIESLRKRRGAETANWLNTLTVSASQNNLPALTTAGNGEAAVDSPTADPKLIELFRWLDKIFNTFDFLASHFNPTAQGTDLIVACTRPQINHPDANTPATEPTLSYDGHLVTRFWSMLLRSTLDHIEIHIMPAENLLGFSLHQIDNTVYKPLVVMDLIWNDNQLNCHIDNIEITYGQLPMLSKELFGDLIRVATGQVNESELFIHSAAGLSLGQNVAAGFSNTSQLQQGVPEEPLISNIVNANASVVPTASPAAGQSAELTTIRAAEQMLSCLNDDIELLLQLGKTALSSENTEHFKAIKFATEKLESIKNNLTKIIQELEQTNIPKVGT